MAIDVGPGATDRTGAEAGNAYTRIDKANPANATGTIDHLEIWANVSIVDSEFGVFTDNGGDSLTCQAGHHCSGAALDVTAGSEVTFDAPGDFSAFSVDSGEYLGCYFAGGTGKIETDSSGGAGLWYINADTIIDNDTSDYSWAASYAMSIYATGTESGGEEVIPVFDYYYNQSRL